MFWIDFGALPVVANVGIFAVAATVIWLAGSRLAHHADALSERTGLGKAFVGMVLLAGATSLPEVATSATAGALGNAPLAISSMFGGVTVQSSILAMADLTLARGALTFFTPRPILLLHGAILTGMIGLAIAGMAVGDVEIPVIGVGIWPVVIATIYIVSLKRLRDVEGHGRWRPIDPPSERNPDVPSDSAEATWFEGVSTGRIWLYFGITSLVILIAGYVLTRVADTVADQTGLGASFVGAAMLAASNSLPETSTTIESVRLGAYNTAISNIFGSNAFNVTQILVADLFYREGPVLADVGPAAIFAGAMGIVATVIYLIGLIEREDRTILRMGFDSVAVLLVYATTLTGLYFLT